MADAQNNQKNQQQDLNQILKVRREKLAALQEAGKDPFRHVKYDVTAHSKDVVEGFEEVDFYFLERIYQRKHGLPWRVIETERTYLREMTVEDVDALYEIYAQEGMTDFIEPLCEKREDEIAYTKAYIENMYVYYGYGMWLVCDRENGEIIGRAGLNTQEIEDEIVLEMGYLIRQEYQRQGYAYEVCTAIMDYAKEASGFSELSCLVEEENHPSLGLLQKLGFSFRKEVDILGKRMKRYVYAL